MRSWIVAMVIALSMLPTMEVVEAAIHWIEHGDGAHGDGHDTTALGSDEHGCSGTFHLCGHSASVLAAGDQIVDRFVHRAEAALPPTVLAREGVSAQAPPIRPPIA